MGEKNVVLKIEFDDSNARNGVERVARELQRAKGSADRFYDESGKRRPDERTDRERDADAIGRSFRNMMIASAAQNVSAQVVQAFNPMKTEFQKQEAVFRGLKEMAGTAAGAALGLQNLDPTTRNASVQLGGMLGGIAGKAGADIAMFQVDEDKYVNERVSQALQSEGSARAAVGQSFSKEQAAEMGKELAKALHLEYRNMVAGVQGADAATPWLPQAMGNMVNQKIRDVFGHLAGSNGGGCGFQNLFGPDE